YRQVVLELPLLRDALDSAGKAARSGAQPATDAANSCSASTASSGEPYAKRCANRWTPIPRSSTPCCVDGGARRLGGSCGAYWSAAVVLFLPARDDLAHQRIARPFPEDSPPANASVLRARRSHSGHRASTWRCRGEWASSYLCTSAFRNHEQPCIYVT